MSPSPETPGSKRTAMGGEVLPSYTSHPDHGSYLMPAGFPVEGFISGLSYEAQESDLFVATYPKNGTTWTQHIVYLILNDGKPISAEQRLDQEFPHLEEVGKEFVENRAAVAAGFRLIKTHLPYDMTPQKSEAKYIFVIRNSKDTVVSFFHHTRGFVKHYNFADGTFDTYFRLFVEGKVDFGSYFDCIRSWLDHKDDANVLLLTYESLRSNPRAGVLKIAEFLDAQVYPERLLSNNEEILNKVLEHSSLNSMQKDPRRWCSERPKEHAPFIRKGSMGGWDEFLTAQQIELLDSKMRDICNEEELQMLGDKY
mmetsp:Transcript_5190/g.14707  ORF Transcript_5190/g.14707 Transcript_5190/m.14707 type:complete len:311 (+) Transcript_5190:151-1083(+)|eukprot:CAMPEP_0181034200 /NCGR_PEP_ID=MMETSP1070-20121207/7684_1 /TAXON_ID=265543 /ORGANISM="Minutocellus polymorphus, Strain NH13" /LENGTH=310 /DNA_ID=CAMNT_0023111719 /DNA_START=67 /DNA_END=999 /DNA_ORIENTATION=+